jgi:hypothetical protein
MRNWRGEFAALAELLDESRQVFEGFGYVVLAVETNIGVVHLALLSLRWGAKNQTPSSLVVSRAGERMVSAHRQLGNP